MTSATIFARWEDSEPVVSFTLWAISSVSSFGFSANLRLNEGTSMQSEQIL